MTKQFDGAIAVILRGLRPHTRTCKATGEAFEVSERAIEFYRRFKIPPPTWSMIARRTRRLAVSNFNQFHRRKCDATGEEIISQYSSQSPYQIYKNEYWWSDTWDAVTHGRGYDFNRPFFDQFHELRLSVPRAAINRDLKNVNSDYVIGGSSMKDCYFVFGGTSGEQSLYVEVIVDSKNCVESAYVRDSEYCYENIMPLKNARCNYAITCMNCLDSSFLYDCRSCTSCFLCTNLRNKQYCFMNEQMTKSAYEAKMREFDLGDFDTLERVAGMFLEIRKKGFVRAINNINAEECTGDDLVECRGCEDAYQYRRSENILHSAAGDMAKEVIDGWGIKSERVAESIRIYDSYDIKFSSHIKNCLDIEYSDDCYNCEHLFGCTGLRYKKFCILNRQYDEVAYYDEVDRIKTAMLARGEYGEFFPFVISPTPYHDSYAAYARSQQGLLTEEQVKKLGAWDEADEGSKLIPDMTALEIPAHVRDANDDMVKKLIAPRSGGRPFTINKQELAFHRAQQLALPRDNYYERAARRADELRSWRLYPAQCVTCKNKIFSGVRPGYPGNLLCEHCYLKRFL